jgi:Protein of unknown function (DUF3071)
MQELRLVAVSEDGSYAILAVPGRGGRFTLPVDDRLRTVARGQFSRLAQYEIEVENPLRPKEIQDRIRAGETADEIADAAGIPVERVRRFEGPPLAEREHQAQQAQLATVRGPGEGGPGPRLGEIVAERLTISGANPETQWDSRKRADGSWQVQLLFTVGGRPQLAEWVYDPRRRHVTPDDDQAARLSLPEADLPDMAFPARGLARATVTPLTPRLGGTGPYQPESRDVPERMPTRAAAPAVPAAPAAPAAPAPLTMAEAGHAEADPGTAAEAGQPADPARERPVRRAAAGRTRRSSVPSWDEIMFDNSRQTD